MPTKIEWTEETWSPIIGCSKLSPGCDHCYAERMAVRLASNPKVSAPYPLVVKDGHWTGKTAFNFESLGKPAKWKKPKMIFVCSMGDLFHESVKIAWLDHVFKVISNIKHHTYLILTKRPKNMKAYFDNRNDPTLQNVWLGVTAENQEQADKRIPILLQIPAVKHFVSIEPMLGPVNLLQTITPKGYHGQSTLSYYTFLDHLDWVICGGETGPGARPIEPFWVLNMRDQCKNNKVPFFFKSWGGKEYKTCRISFKEYKQYPS